MDRQTGRMDSARNRGVPVRTPGSAPRLVLGDGRGVGRGGARGFTIVELIVTCAVMAVLLGVLWQVLYGGQSAATRGIAVLDDVAKQMRLSEQLKRVLRMASAVTLRPTPGQPGSIYDIRYVDSLDDTGTQKSYKPAVLRMTPGGKGGLAVDFQKGDLLGRHYDLSCTDISIYAGDQLVMVDFSGGREDSSFTVSSPYLDVSGSNLLPPEMATAAHLASGAPGLAPAAPHGHGGSPGGQPTGHAAAGPGFSATGDATTRLGLRPRTGKAPTGLAGSPATRGPVTPTDARGATGLAKTSAGQPAAGQTASGMTQSARTEAERPARPMVDVLRPMQPGPATEPAAQGDTVGLRPAVEETRRPPSGEGGTGTAIPPPSVSLPSPGWTSIPAETPVEPRPTASTATETPVEPQAAASAASLPPGSSEPPAVERPPVSPPPEGSAPSQPPPATTPNGGVTPGGADSGAGTAQGPTVNPSSGPGGPPTAALRPPPPDVIVGYNGAQPGASPGVQPPAPPAEPLAARPPPPPVAPTDGGISPAERLKKLRNQPPVTGDQATPPASTASANNPF